MTVDRQGTVRDSYRFGFVGEAVESWSYARFDYNAWGAPEPVTQDGAHQDLYKVDPNLLRRWEGGRFDADVAAYKFGDRWMSTKFQRWLSEDPSGLAFGTNPYEALNNSPYNYTDPNGHEPVSVAVYTLWAGVNALADTAIETAFVYGTATYTGDYGDWNQYSVGWALAKNFGVNFATAGIGNKAKWGGKIASWALRKTIETGADTAYDVGVMGRDWDDALVSNAVGNVGGDLALKGGKYLYYNRGLVVRSTSQFVVGFGEGLLETSLHRGRAFYSTSLGNVAGTVVEAVGNGVKRGLQNVRVNAPTASSSGVVTGLRNRGAFQRMTLTGETRGGLSRVSAEWRAQYGPSAMRRHHLVPQAMVQNQGFMQRMRALGHTDDEIVTFVNRQIADIPNVQHMQIHAEGWNDVWRTWSQRNPSFNVSDIRAQMRSMMQEFDLPRSSLGGPQYGS